MNKRQPARRIIKLQRNKNLSGINWSFLSTPSSSIVTAKKNENHGKLLMLFVNAIQSSICWWRTESRYETSLSKLTNFINDESSKHVWCHRIYPTVLPHFPRICHVLEFHVPRILKVTGIKTFQLALYNFYCVCFISSFEVNSGAIKSFQTLWSFVQLIGTCLTSLSVKILKLAYFTDVVNFETGNGAFMLKLLTCHFFFVIIVDSFFSDWEANRFELIGKFKTSSQS